MKRSPYRFIIAFGILFVVLAVILYFVNPLAPLLLVLSLVVQVPLIVIITRTSMAGSYADRAHARRQAFEKDGNAAAWLAGEENEAHSIAFRYLSKTGKMRNALNRAQPLCLLGRTEEAARLLEEVNPARLVRQEVERYEAIQQCIQQAEDATLPSE